MKLLIRNLARSTTEADLVKIFEKFGTVQYCKLVLDTQTGTSKGFAFIEMPRPGDARAAVKTLNGYSIHGKNIRVKKAAQKKTTTEPVIQEKPPVEEGKREDEAKRPPPPEKPVSNKNDRKNSTVVNRNIWSSNE